MGRTADLTWGQQRVAQLMADLRPDHTGLNLRFACRVRSGVTAEEVASGIRTMMEASESVRTLFNPDAPKDQQRVLAEGVVHVPIVTVETVTFALAEESAAELAAAEFGTEDLPIRMSIMADREGPAFLLFALSHLASDFLGARWLVWHLRHILQLFVTFSGEEPVAVHPVDVSDWESSEAGQREGARALRRHELNLAKMPQSMLPRLPREPLRPRYQYVEIKTSAGAWCLSHLAERHGVSETAVGYGVLSLILARVSGLARGHLQICVGNRADRAFATVVGTLTQDVPACVTVDDSDFDTLLRRSAGAVRQATMTGRFPHQGLVDVRRRVEAERGFPLDLSYWLNSRLFSAVSVDAPTAARITEECGRTSIQWQGGDERSTSTLFCYLDRLDDMLAVRTLVDTAYVTRDEAERWLRAFETVLVTAALLPDLGVEALGMRAGIEPFRATDEWAQIDHSWIHLPSTAARLRAALPGVSLRVEVDARGDQPALVAVVTDPDPGYDVSALAGTDVIEALRGCKVAMRPHRFTLRTREAADEDH
nr:condensation domain-containing protein [Micromonospora tarapacensis]